MSKMVPSVIVCVEYSAPPDPGFPGEKICTMAPGTRFGPVHWWDWYRGFIFVAVPSTLDPNSLVFVNLQNQGQAFATLEPRRTSGFLD